MKNKLTKVLLLLFIIFAAPTFFIHAYYDPLYPGSFSNPLQVEIVQTPSQIYDQQLRDQALRLQQQSQQNTQNLILHQQQELQRQSLQQQLNARLPSNIQSQLTCQNGYIKNSRGGCSSFDVACGDSFGQGWKWAGTKDAQGQLNCGCKDNYIREGEECVIAAPVKTAPAITFEQNTNPVSTCEKGYKWNADTQYCVISSDATNVQKCEYAYGINSIWSGNLDTQGEPVCGCINGFEMNGLKGISKMCVRSAGTIQSDVTVATSAPIVFSTSTDKVEMKPKSLWVRIWRWFSF